MGFCISHAVFSAATFTADAWFLGATFVRGAQFEGATFTRRARFHGATFAGNAWFRRAKFGGAEFREVDFGEVEFAEDSEFDGARVAQSSLDVTLDELAKLGVNTTEIIGGRGAPHSFDVVLPGGWTTRVAQPAEGEDEGWLYVVRDQNSSEQPAKATDDREGQNGSKTGP